MTKLKRLQDEAYIRLCALRNTIWHSQPTGATNVAAIRAIDFALEAVNAPLPNRARIGTAIAKLRTGGFESMYPDPSNAANAGYFRTLIAVLAALNKLASALPQQNTGARLSRPCSWIVDCAARALPVRHRPRYSEEFLGELTDVAKNGRVAQMCYAVGLMSRVIGLRWALRDSVTQGVESR